MRRSIFVLTIAAAVAAGCASEAPSDVLEQTQRFSTAVELEAPDPIGQRSLEQLLAERRSDREYAATVPALDVIGQLLWAGQGVTSDEGYRTAPSAGALYPLELFAVTATELMHYLPAGHRVERRADTATLNVLGDLAFQQEFVSRAPLVIVVTAVPGRTEQKYGAAAWDLVNREAGHAAQNILLQATALGMVAVPVGGFDPAAVADRLALEPGHVVLYLIPVGYPVDPT